MLGNCESISTIDDKSDQSKGTIFRHFTTSFFNLAYIPTFWIRTAYCIHLFIKLGEIVFKRPFDAQTGFDELQICTNNDPVSK